MASQEQISEFSGTFFLKQDNLKSSLKIVNSGSDLDAARSKLQQLSQLVSEYAPVLPSYELRKAQLSLSELQAELLLVEERLRPKKKFKFQRGSNTSKPEKTKSTDEVDFTAVERTSTVTTKPTISGKANERLVLCREEVDEKDIWLQSLVDCTVFIHGVPSTLHLTEISCCTIVGGPVETSIFLDKCTNTTLVLGCQQLRAHHSTDCTFYLRLQSRAIIEDCDRCRFAPYNWEDEQAERDFERLGFLSVSNNWDQVDDFNWLSQEQRSPHWSILPEAERRSNWTSLLD